MLKIKSFDELNSTNDYALEYIKRNFNIKDTLIIAKTQTAGRGRLNKRVWVSCLGNFHGSYILNLNNLNIDTTKTTLINYAALLALKDLFDEISKESSKEVTIKNPNDILINNKKVAGVLVEVSFPYVVVGVGVNLKIAPIEASTDIFDEFDKEFGINEFGEQLYNTLLLRLKDV